LVSTLKLTYDESPSHFAFNFKLRHYRMAATSAPLIEHSIDRATGIVYNISGGPDMTLQAGAYTRPLFGSM
jgi:cell division protein FtsZ